jgi:hypothetical protein
MPYHTANYLLIFKIKFLCIVVIVVTCDLSSNRMSSINQNFLQQKQKCNISNR